MDKVYSLEDNLQTLHTISAVAGLDVKDVKNGILARLQRYGILLATYPRRFNENRVLPHIRV
jgi:hypothetical protein